MADELPTVMVIHKESGTEMRINTANFDPEQHQPLLSAEQVLNANVGKPKGKPLPAPISISQPVTPGDLEDDDDEDDAETPGDVDEDGDGGDDDVVPKAEKQKKPKKQKKPAAD